MNTFIFFSSSCQKGNYLRSRSYMLLFTRKGFNSLNFNGWGFKMSQTPSFVDPAVLFVHSPLPSSPYGSMARKRSAQEGVQGAPVNKRKSLLMKPRHYSPSEACEEESEDLAPPQDKEELRNIDTPAGKQMSCCFVCFDEQLTLNFKIPSVAFIFPSLCHQPAAAVIVQWK